jgi:hypothetical protein
MHKGSFKSSFLDMNFTGLNCSKESGKGPVSFKSFKMTQESCADSSSSAIKKHY